MWTLGGNSVMDTVTVTWPSLKYPWGRLGSRVGEQRSGSEVMVSALGSQALETKADSGWG
jgi:hypothetical protein